MPPQCLHIGSDPITVAYDVRLLSGTSQRTGIPNYELELLAALAETPGWRGLCLTDRSWPVPAALRSASIQWSQYPSMPLWQHAILPLAIKRSGAQVYHSLAFTAPFVHVVPSIVTIHDLSFMTHPETMSRKAYTYLRTLTRHALAHAAHVVVPSQSVAVELAAHFPHVGQRVSVIPYGVSQRFRPLPSDVVARFVATHALPVPFVLSVASLTPRKNGQRLIQAFAKAIRNLNLPHHLLLAGPTGSAADTMHGEIARLGIEDRVHHVGYVSEEDLPLMYASATALLYVSIYEGFGLPLLEAMACDCPVLTSSISSMPEVAGDAAILVDPLNVDDMADGIARLLSDRSLQSQLRSRARDRVGYYSWSATAAATMRLYSTVVAERPAPLVPD